MDQNPSFSSETSRRTILTACRSGWISYGSNESESIDKWLEKHRPSKVSRDDGIYWISVRGKANGTEDSDAEDDDAVDPIGLKRAWDEHLSSGKTVNSFVLQNLALEYNVITGKWLFYVQPDKVDMYWQLVASQISKDSMDSFASSAKVSTADRSQRTHVFCVYSRNFTNREEIVSLEKAIRKLGIECVMYYKADAYTTCNIYSMNEWKIRATLFRSNFDSRTRESKVTP